MIRDMEKLIQYVSDKIPEILDFTLEVILALIVFLVGMKLIKWVRKLVRHSLERTRADKGVCQFIDSLLKFALYALLIFSIAQKFGFNTASVAAVLASCGVAVGLALQGSLSNLAGGVLILILKPFVVGDYIIEDNKKCEGVVKEIQLFYTKLLTLDNKTVIIPNGALANTSLTNVTAQNKRRLDLTVGISYHADIKKAKEVLQNMVRADEYILREEPVEVFVDNLAESAVVLGMRGWVKKEDYWHAKWQILEKAKLTLDENEIEIPFNQVVVHMEK